MKSILIRCVVVLVAWGLLQTEGRASENLKVHGIFRSHMVLQRDKPIRIWGWAPAREKVSVKWGDMEKSSTADESGAWAVIFEPQPANPVGQQLEVRTGKEKVVMEDILVGDLWVMNGQSNMAFALKAVYEADMESLQAHLPLLRHFRIQSGAESEVVEKDIRDEFIFGADETNKNWRVVTPEAALEMGAIGFAVGSRLQRALQIPIGIIDNARGGASLESLVPRHQFAKHPEAAEYLAWVDARNAAFSEEQFLADEMAKWEVKHQQWEEQVVKDKEKGVTAKRREPAKPTGNIRTWSVPGRSPSDAASCYNGMFGVFKGLEIKGVAFHQGFNNAMMNTSCKPRFYRILMKLMVDGWREDFNDPQLPVAVIGLCAGGDAQTRLNFEEKGFSTAALIRESQRLGLADAEQPAQTMFIPSYDQKIPQLHTKKKVELGERTARWALKEIYGMDQVVWDTAALVSAEPKDGKILLTFDRPVRPDDFGSELEGFSVADESGAFYMAQAVYPESPDKAERYKQVEVSSALVSAPRYVRYAWARAPMGNLKVDGIPWQPLQSFRTDALEYTPEVSHQDPEGQAKNAAAIKELKAQAAQALENRLAH